MGTFYRSITFFTASISVAVLLITATLFADNSGRTGRTLKSGTTGCSCHSSSASSAVTVTISGPDSLTPSMQGTYTVRITGGPIVKGGVDVAVSSGTLAIITSDVKVSSSEIVHSTPKTASSGAVVFSFSYTAPATLGAQTMYATGISCNGTGGSGGDSWNFATNKTVTVVAQLPVELTSFSALIQAKSIKLDWETATEVNNAGFSLEKKEDKSGWMNIGFVQGRGNSNSPMKYSYTDNKISGRKLYKYRLIQMDIDGSMTYSKEVEVNVDFIPGVYSLNQNYPNPFNPSTLIKYNLPISSYVSIKVYNAIGKEVVELVNGYQEANEYAVKLDASKLTSGIYYYTIKAGNFVQTKKMIFIK